MKCDISPALKEEVCGICKEYVSKGSKGSKGSSRKMFSECLDNAKELNKNTRVDERVVLQRFMKKGYGCISELNNICSASNNSDSNNSIPQHDAKQHIKHNLSPQNKSSNYLPQTTHPQTNNVRMGAWYFENLENKGPASPSLRFKYPSSSSDDYFHRRPSLHSLQSQSSADLPQTIHPQKNNMIMGARYLDDLENKGPALSSLRSKHPSSSFHDDYFHRRPLTSLPSLHPLQSTAAARTSSVISQSSDLSPTTSLPSSLASSEHSSHPDSPGHLSSILNVGKKVGQRGLYAGNQLMNDSGLYGFGRNITDNWILGPLQFAQGLHSRYKQQ